MTSVQDELEDLLAEGMEAVRQRQHDAFDRLIQPMQGRCVLFGAGLAGRNSLKNLRTSGIVPLAFVDNNRARWGSQVDGIPVFSPEEAAAKFGDSALFVVTIYSQGHVFRRTREQLEALGIHNIVSDSALRWRYPDNMLPFFCHDLPERVYAARERVLAASKVWADDYSRREYLNQVRWRALGDLGALNLPVEEESYFPSSLVSLQADEVFIDCGAYTGDTAQRVIELSEGRFRHITAIEADRANYEVLRKWIDGLPNELMGRISALNIAVGAVRGEVSFDPDNTMVASGGSAKIECQRLDDLLEGVAPTFIKMDIEGAELDALAGARATIQRHRPVLAVCVYHRQSDLWQIPLAIAAMQGQYRLYIRPHEGDGWQSVLYALPPERVVAARG